MAITYAQMKKTLKLPASASNADVDAALDRIYIRYRDKQINGAIRAGKITESSRGHYEAMWAEDPRKLWDTLDSLAPSASQPATPISPVTVAPDGDVSISEEGVLNYHGFPVANAGGRPQVLTRAGWLAVDEVVKAGISDEEIRDAYASARMFPDGHMGELLNEGPR